MGRPRKNLKEENKNIQESVVETLVEGPKESILSQQELASLKTTKNSEHNDKILLFQSIQDLQIQKDKADKALKEIIDELNSKNRQIQWLTTEISAHNSQLKNLKAVIEKEKEDEYASLKIQTDRVNKSNEEYQSLIKEVSEKKEYYNEEIRKISEERALYEAESIRLNKAMAENENRLKYDLIDLETQKDVLAKEREAFEAEKLALEPEMKRIQEIKNENRAFTDKLEAQMESIKAEREAMIQERESMQAQVAQELKKVQNYELQIIQREQELQNRVQNIMDYELEVKAREAEANKAIKRYQLTKLVEEGKEKES